MSPPAHTVLGALQGPAVVVLDGTRAGGLGDEAHVAAVRAGVRLVAPHFAADVRALVDALGLEELGLLAQGAGIPLALCAAAGLGERVRAISLLGPTPAEPSGAPPAVPLAVWDAEPTLRVYDAALRFCAPA